MKQCRRLIGLLLTVVMLCSMFPVAFADATSNYPDFPTGWSKTAMSAAVANGLLNGYEDGKIYPGASLTRAQFAAIITRAFGAETKADISAYEDVLTGAWYYDAIAKAVKMGALNGKSATQMDPDAPITRQETFTAVARIFVLSDDDTSVLNKFQDKGRIASWAAEYMADLTKRGYINGDPEGNSSPEKHISREEFAQFMHNAIRTYITKPGTYTDDLEGITVIRVGNVVLKNLTNTSDLIIGDGVGRGNITIDGVTIEKRLLARGGTIKVSKSKLGEYVVVNNVNGITYFKNYRREAFFKGIVENTKAQFLTHSSGGVTITPSDPVTVTFYSIYSDTPGILPPAYILGTTSIEKGTTVDVSNFPNAQDYVRRGYVEDANVASLYAGNEWTHEITPEFWYVKDGVMTPFNETVEVNEDTSVYLLSKSLTLMLAFDGMSQPLSVSADYNKDTRIANSIKDIIAKSGRQQLQQVLDRPELLPKYHEIVGKVVDKMVSAGVIELDGDKKNIQVVDVPIKISMLIKETTIHQMVKDFVRGAVKDSSVFAEIYSHIDIRGNADALDIGHVISGMTDDEIKAHVNGLSYAEKQNFADKLFEVIKKDENYKYFVSSLMNKDTFEINKVNVSEIAIIKDSIRELTLEKALAESDNSFVNELVDAIGIEEIRPYYESMRDRYCDDLEIVIDDVLASSDSNIKKNYTTSLTWKLNIFDIYEKLYDKAADKVIQKLKNANIYYDENKYLKFLVEQDFLSYLVDDSDKSLANGDFTGYRLKGVMDYYDYLTMLLIVGDDAITWYGEEINLSEAQFEALYDAMFNRIFAVHEKMNDILIAFKDEGTLPPKVQNAVDSIEQLNSLLLQYGDKLKVFIEKYLGSSINVKFEDESIAENDKVVKMIDLLVGKDDPRVNIDTVYATIYEYDDVLQAKLKQLIESDEFKKAVDKFESTSFGEILSGKGQLGTIGEKIDELKNNGRIESALDSVYDFFYIVANEGIEAFRVPTTEVTDIDIYKVKIGKIEITVQRAYR